MSEALEGGCLCGQVRYRIDEDSPPAIACFCTDCQTRSGSAVGLTMPVWSTCFSIEGELVEGDRTLPTEAEATVYCCARCLTEIYSHNERMIDVLTVRAATLDGAAEIDPAAYIWTRSRQPWITVPADARQYETQPDDPAVWMDIFQMGRRPK